MTKPLWEPGLERKTLANMTRFMQLVNERFGLDLHDYHQLYQWSIDNIPSFWTLVWEFTDIKASQPYTQVVHNLEDMFDSEWFEGATLNFAENLLRYRDDRIALIFSGEDKVTRHLTYRELYEQVACLSTALKQIGVTTGDRVVGFMPNLPETLIAMLATVSIGAIWSSCSPDFGFNGVMDRFGQIEPKVLFAANGYYYNGKEFDCLEKVARITAEIPSLEKVIIVPFTRANADVAPIKKAVCYKKLVAETEYRDIIFTKLPFDHPLYIMYSSGTTGKPKCIVHGAGGTLLQHMKELIIHTDLTREDIIFYFTTCGWMMWNWLVSALGVGATLVLYDGSPFYPNAGTLWQLAQENKITVFGTSAKYLSALEQTGLKPGEIFDLSHLKTILSTGSPLAAESFHYVYRDIKSDVCLSSISGGTDIISCFALGNPLGPVYPGELQCRGLGMKVEAFHDGKSVLSEKGELVCTSPFPSMPIYFWNDSDDKQYFEAYFNSYPNIWHHGDYVEITPRGGMIIYGRSDTTLNPGGVKIGTAEIYRQVETIPEVMDSLVIGQDWQNDTRVILFVKLVARKKLTSDLEVKIKQKIRENTTPRHVPAIILQIDDIPYTINGKKVEIAVRKIIHGQEVTNMEALANPQSLELYKDLPELNI